MKIWKNAPKVSAEHSTESAMRVDGAGGEIHPTGPAAGRSVDAGNHAEPTHSVLDHSATVGRVATLLAKLVCRCTAASGIEAKDPRVVPMPTPVVLPLSVRIKDALATYGSMSPKEMVGMLGVPSSSLGRALDLLTHSGEICAHGNTKGRRYHLPTTAVAVERRSA